VAGDCNRGINKIYALRLPWSNLFIVFPNLPRIFLPESGLEREAALRNHRCVTKLLLAILVWLIMGAAIAAGILLAFKGSLWLLIVSLLGFIFLVGKIGCLSH
jgi:hypothetical protein